jgi:hypothetical protein
VGSLDKRDRTPRRSTKAGGGSRGHGRASHRHHDDEEFIGTSPNCPQPMAAGALSTSPAPPYMPIQGHRRMQAFEKRKKKDKGCTQQ